MATVFEPFTTAPKNKKILGVYADYSETGKLLEVNVRLIRFDPSLGEFRGKDVNDASGIGRFLYWAEADSLASFF